MDEQSNPQNPRCFICRCEEVTADRLQTEMTLGAGSLNDLKRRTRAGMGLCQGSYCMGEISQMLATYTGKSLAEIAPVTFRPPARGVTVDVLARSSE